MNDLLLAQLFRTKIEELENEIRDLRSTPTLPFEPDLELSLLRALAVNSQRELVLTVQRQAAIATLRGASCTTREKLP